MSITSNKNLFGTDGIRGKAGEFPITIEVAKLFGMAVAKILGENVSEKIVLIGRDTRQSGAELSDAMCAGVSCMGLEAKNCGVLPTPALAYLAKQTGACAAVMISASHNPYYDNGFKVFRGDGFKCDDASELEISNFIQNNKTPGTKTGVISSWPEAEATYVELAAKNFGAKLDLSKFKIVVDTANGASYKTTPLTLKKLGAKLVLTHDKPDGININEGCGSNCPENMAELVKKNNAHIGLAHDGDADRVCFCDETGYVLDGDEVLCILGLHLASKKALENNALVATVMSNCGLEEALQKSDIKVIRAQVGDRHVLEEMTTNHLNLGGEQSGHIILSDFNPTGDGLNTALQLLRVMVETGKPLSVLRAAMHKYPQLLINLKVRDKKPIESMPTVVDAVKAAENELGREGRVLLRYSGTEPKIRLLIEAKNELLLKPLSESILKPIKDSIGTD